MRTIVLAVSLSLISLPACRGGSTARSEKDRTRGHPLALREPSGTGPGDEAARRIGDLQDHVRRAPGAPEPWIALGEAWVRKAREASDPGLYHSAADAADAALALSPGLPRALELRGLVLMEGHRFEEARALAAELTSRRPSYSPGLGLLSDALLELGRFEEAAAAAQRMMDLKPSLPSYVRASYLLWLQGNTEAALEAARLAVDAGGDAEARAWVRTQAALVRWHRGEYARADAELDLALAEFPDHAAALVAKGRVALSRGDAASARRLLERADARAPLAETAWLLGDAAEAQGDLAGAREAWARAEKRGRAFDRRTLALFLATRGERPAEAVRLAEEERTVRDDVYTEDTYAWALYRAGRLGEADEAAARATRLGTPDARLLFHAGAIQLAQGHRREGTNLLRRALRLNPGFDRVGAAEARRLLADATARRAS
jgi:tetratricopeptide (TPR) repeat protein